MPTNANALVVHGLLALRRHSQIEKDMLAAPETAERIIAEGKRKKKVGSPLDWEAYRAIAWAVVQKVDDPFLTTHGAVEKAHASANDVALDADLRHALRRMTPMWLSGSKIKEVTQGHAWDALRKEIVAKQRNIETREVAARKAARNREMAERRRLKNEEAAAREAKQRALAERKAAHEAKQKAAREAKERALAEQKAAREAKQRALAEQKAAREAALQEGKRKQLATNATIQQTETWAHAIAQQAIAGNGPRVATGLAVVARNFAAIVASRAASNAIEAQAKAELAARKIAAAVGEAQKYAKAKAEANAKAAQWKSHTNGLQRYVSVACTEHKEKMLDAPRHVESIIKYGGVTPWLYRAIALMLAFKAKEPTLTKEAAIARVRQMNKTAELLRPELVTDAIISHILGPWAKWTTCERELVGAAK